MSFYDFISDLCGCDDNSDIMSTMIMVMMMTAPLVVVVIQVLNVQQVGVKSANHQPFFHSIVQCRSNPSLD